MNSSEQRGAFRIQMPEGQKQATLRIEGRTFGVHLVDASATGVALACPLHLALEIDDCCELHTASGGSFIRIVRKGVFSDGILLGALRTDDMPERGRGWLGLVLQLLAAPCRSFVQYKTPGRIAIVVALAVLIFGAAFSGWHFHWFGGSRPIATAVPVEPVVANTSTQAELQEAMRQIESMLPDLNATDTGVDQRAQRIFEQQKQLLQPERSRSLRLTPSQESRIQRAIEAAEAAAEDMRSNELWEAIRRSEQTILSVLSPTQIKAWRQQSGT